MASISDFCVNNTPINRKTIRQTETDRQPARQTGTQTDDRREIREIRRQRDRKAEIQEDRQTDGKADRQEDRIEIPRCCDELNWWNACIGLYVADHQRSLSCNCRFFHRTNRKRKTSLWSFPVKSSSLWRRQGQKPKRRMTVPWENRQSDRFCTDVEETTEW